MPAVLPLGQPVPDDGALPPEVGARVRAAAEAGEPRTFSLYVHVPFCTVRCGYCDFNTYTAETFGPGAGRGDYWESAVAELDHAVGVLERSGVPARPLHTVFVGGGTPTLLPASHLVRILDEARERFGLAEDAEVTTEANPDTLTPEYVAELAEGGFTRLSVGMQSAVPHVLAMLERTHTPANVPAAVAAARAAGMEVSLDLIYGTPGESLADWRTTLEAAVAMAPDHVSAYSLIVEEGTRFGAQVARGQVPDVDPDVQADEYLLADELLSAAGYRWYEVSNWAHDPEDAGVHRARHNVAYWRDQDWWGVGPGAHSHLAGVRFWNAKHPAAYAQRLATGVAPAVGREMPDDEARRLERIMLAARTVEGLDLDEVRGGVDPATLRARVAALIADGLVEGPAALRGTVVPTLRGRLQNDRIVRDLAGF
ncbi:radical SAM family heme chaperone HemW [Micrococcus sp.]|uniref:radical SAM family heme chaperone HemW n=1 Tax=Micrococcus sp. TaxID=1271 RepID=UPI0026DCC4CA|nr:radical SAM family heme chaperone HemW [Micrococcus sp.]MDO4238673.1 radical SAM family heme chaperone HemW [Micrococcus sp.]